MNLKHVILKCKCFNEQRVACNEVLGLPGDEVVNFLSVLPSSHLFPCVAAFAVALQKASIDFFGH